MSKIAVILTGNVLPEHQAEDAWAAAAKVFKLEQSAFHSRVLIRCPIIVRETENPLEANNIRAALANCGVDVSVVEATESKWLFQQEGRACGPVPMTYLEGRYRDGSLDGNALVKEVAKSEWVPLSNALDADTSPFVFDLPTEQQRLAQVPRVHGDNDMRTTHSILDFEEVTESDWQAKIGCAEKEGIVFVIFYSATTGASPIFEDFLAILAGKVIPQIQAKVQVYRCCLPRSQALANNLIRNQKLKTLTITSFGLMIAGGKNSLYFLGDRALASKNAMLRSVKSALIHKEIKADEIPQPDYSTEDSAIQPAANEPYSLVREITLPLLIIAGVKFFQHGISTELIAALAAFACLAIVGDWFLEHLAKGRSIDKNLRQIAMYAGVFLAVEFLNSQQLIWLASFSIASAIAILLAQKMKWAFGVAAAIAIAAGVLGFAMVLAYENQNSTGVPECDDALAQMDEVKACIVNQGLKSDVDVESIRADIRESIAKHERADGAQEAALGCKSLKQALEPLLAKCR